MAGSQHSKLQSDVELIYEIWKEELLHDCQSEPKKYHQLSPPLLLQITKDYFDSSTKIMMIGQETFGWSWGSDLAEKYPAYPNPWPFDDDIVSLYDFLKIPNAVTALCWAYKSFDFAKYQPLTKRSFWWQAFREIQNWENACLMWTNLGRFDFDGASILEAPNAIKTELIKYSANLIASEIRLLNPSICLFFTGPNYDALIAAAYPGALFLEIDNQTPVRKFAKIQHKNLPELTFRTYHPAYLSRAGIWGNIESIRQMSLR